MPGAIDNALRIQQYKRSYYQGKMMEYNLERCDVECTRDYVDIRSFLDFIDRVDANTILGDAMRKAKASNIRITLMSSAQPSIDERGNIYINPYYSDTELIEFLLGTNETTKTLS